jgi:general L-amino acid transport system substrate-binding protein
MIRRLMATILALVATACGPAPEAPPAAPQTTAAEPGKPLAYKPAVSSTLAAVRKRGVLTCGVHPGLPGFAFKDVQGAWRGIDADICRAIAAATLGDANKARFLPVSTEDRFRVLQDGRVDVLVRNTSWTFARDAGLGLAFTAVTYYDGQGFLAPKTLGLSSAEELSGARVCVLAGTENAQNIIDWFGARGIEVTPVVVANEDEARRRYESDTKQGGCDVISTDISGLAALRSQLNNPGAHIILPTVISKEPLGPVVRRDDPVWADIVRWTVYSTLLAEELGLSQRTVEQARQTATDPETRRLLGVEGDLGKLLGLSPDWAFQVVRQVGAYHDIFQRDVGVDSPLKLDRGLNALWNAPQPGLMYAPPMR